MKKGDKNRGEKLLQKLIPGTKFQDGIQFIRKENNIPPKGFSDKPSVGKWYTERQSIFEEETAALADFKAEIRDFLIDQALPINAWWECKITEYVLADGNLELIPLLPGIAPFVEMNKPNPTKRGSYTDLRIYEGATQRDVREFLSLHWHRVKPSYRVGTHKNIRKEKNPKANDHAVAIYDLPKSKRRKMASTNELMATTKEIEVSRILKKTGSSKSGDGARAIKYRRKNAKR